MNSIKIKGLRKSFGKIKAVDGVDLVVKKGEIFGLLGPNGAGKTTLIHSMLGVYQIDTGEIKVLGYQMPKEKIKARKKIGFMPQELSVYNDLTVMDNIFFYGRLYGLKDKEIRSRAETLLSFLKLEEKKNVIARKMSGGQKRRLSLGIALLHSPELLILDEPTVGVDPVLRKEFWTYFEELKKEGKTILITTHITDEALRVDRVGLMIRGKIIAVGPPQQLMEESNVDTLEDLFIKYEAKVKEVQK